MNDVISVVIVESQPLMRTALSMALSSDGMQVLAEIEKSRDAMPVASALLPDLILFSVEYPGQDDMERISVLRRALPAIFIVALVTGEDGRQHRAALDHGAHLVLSKSAPRAEILTTLKQASLKKIYPANASMQAD